MGEGYDDDVRERDSSRSKELILGLACAGIDRSVAAELMSIGFRSGVEAGRERAASALAGLALA